MSNCPKCGSPLENGVKFCPSCNSRVINDVRRPVRNVSGPNAVPVQPAVQTAPVKPQPVVQPKQVDIDTSRNQANENIKSENFMKAFLRELFSFNCQGRLNRARYWKLIFTGALFISLCLVILAIMQVKGKVVALLMIAYWILTIPFSVRRVHDLDKSGWWLLLCAVPYVNAVASIYFGFFKGTDGPNRYGPDPLA